MCVVCRCLGVCLGDDPVFVYPVCFVQVMPGNDHHVWIGLGFLSACILRLAKVWCVCCEVVCVLVVLMCALKVGDITGRGQFPRCLACVLGGCVCLLCCLM